MPPKKKVEEPKILLGRPSGTLRMGMVGLPNVGKSTTFNLLAKQAVPAENFPFCTIDPHEARMSVPDDRFKWLVSHFKPKSEVAATLTIYDIAGLVPGAHANEGLGNAFLSHIQAVDGIYHVVRAFTDPDIVHTEGEVNPVKDLETIRDELRLKDIERCEKSLEGLKKETARGQNKAKLNDLAVMEMVQTLLVADKKWISERNWKAAEVEVINEYTFLTAKPVVYLVNMSEQDFVKQANKWLAKIFKWVQENHPGSPIIPYSAAFESKLVDMESDEARKAYIEEVSAKGGMLDRIINTGYSTLRLIHYFTCGADEVKCWTIRDGTKAPQAAGIIHTDFERGFICADVYKQQDLLAEGSEAAVKAAGKLSQKGKDYIVEDGDCIFFKCNPGGGKKK